MTEFFSPIRKLDHEAVRAWLAGQQEAAQFIAQERRIYLQNLSQEEAWKTYQILFRQSLGGRDPSQPSFVLRAMREALSHPRKSHDDKPD
jgi:hypothetical protein